MKKITKVTSGLCLAALMCAAFAGCGTTVVKDSNPYSFTNPGHAVAEADADMTLDGVFDEARWSESKWLAAVDRINASQYADIMFTTSYGEKGVYFGMQVEETGTNIYVNHSRTSYYNSCIEMYMGPSTEGYDSALCFEFDFLADGTYEPKLNYNSWNSAYTTWDKMPVVASQQLGGEVNTAECYGYTIEAFFPWEYLEFAGYSVETQEERDALVLGIDPVHIFSFNYDGTDLNADRFWSQWSADYISVGFQNPSTFFRFGQNGLLACDYTVTYGGTGKGEVQESHGWDYVLQQADATFSITTYNGAKVTSLTVNGVDYTGSLLGSGGSFTFTVPKSEFTENIAIAVEIN